VNVFRHRLVTVSNGDMNMIFTLGLALTQALLPVSSPAQPGKLAAAQPPSPVTISVDTQAKGADVAYRTIVRNTGKTPVATMITQQLPDGAHDPTATDGGGVRGDHIQWTITIPSGGMVVLGSTVTTPMPRPTAFSSICVVGKDGVALDCASGVAEAVVPPSLPMWRRVLPWAAAGLLALGVLVWAGWSVGRWVWRHWPKRWRRPKQTPQERTPRERTPRDRTATAVSAAAVALLAVLSGTLLLLAPLMKKTLNQMAGSKLGGWSGTASALAPGAAVSDHAVEFTMYQANCTKGNGCTVVVAARNTTGQDQLFYRSMQRLYTGPDTWVTPDNAGDFFQPLPAGERRLVTLHFPLSAGQIPTRLELREGAFARGVYYKLP
jgi:hypothetical protein